MKTLIFAFAVLIGQSAFASSQFVPSQFLAEKPIANKSMQVNTDEDFAANVDHLMDVQQKSLENLSTERKSIHLTQLLTSFTVSKSGLFGLSALSASSNTTLFWNKKVTVAAPKADEAKSFQMDSSDDELALQMKIDDVTDYLVRNNKVNDAAKLRENLDQVIRKAHGIFGDIDALETPNWRVGGYRLDLSVGASGVVTPFTKVGENVRLWLEWTRPAHKPVATPANTKVTRFVSKVLNDTEAATLNVNMPHFELQNLYVGLGEDLKAGLFGFGSSTFGFVGYVKFVKKPKTTVKTTLVSEDQAADEEYPVIQERTDVKSLPRFVSIPSKKIKKGIENSIHYAAFFSNKAERIESVHWELGQIREIATITKSGLFGLSTLSTKGVFTFIFNRKQPQTIALAASAPAPTSTYLSLIRLSFVTVLGVQVPEIANFELRPNVELFWK